jgi:hypothetical protein
VPIASAFPDGWKIEKSSAKAKVESEDAKAKAARETQEKNASALQKQAVPGDNKEGEDK